MTTSLQTTLQETATGRIKIEARRLQIHPEEELPSWTFTVGDRMYACVLSEDGEVSRDYRKAMMDAFVIHGRSIFPQIPNANYFSLTGERLSDGTETTTLHFSSREEAYND